MQPNFANLKPVASPAGGGPNLSALKPVGVTPPPASANNPGTGLAYTVMNAGYGVAKGITQAFDKPFLSLLGVPVQAYNSIMGNTDALKAGQTTGYDFGDFLGKAKPLAAGITVGKPMTPGAAAQSLANYAGLTLEGATDMINPVGGGAEAKVAEAATSMGGKALDAGKAALKFATGSGRGQFATGQGIASGLESYGKGNSAGGATATGVFSGIASAATMKMFDVTGNFLKDNYGFVTSALKTKAGQAFTNTLDSIGKTVQSMVDSTAMKDVAGRFTDNYHAVQQDVNHAMLGLVSGIRDNVKLPDQKTWIPQIINQIGGKLKADRDAIQVGFDKVFGSNTVIKKADALKSAYQEGIDQINKLGSGALSFMAKQNPEAGASMNSSLAPNLYDYMQRLKSDVLDPVAKGAGFNMSKLNDFINFVDTKGTGGEEALMGKMRTALHQDVESGLNDMGARGKSLLDSWGEAKENYRQYSNTKDSAFATIWDKINNPATLGRNFLDGSILKDKEQMGELENLIGPEGIGALRAQIMHTSLTDAISHFSDIKVGSPPEKFDAARKAASAEIQKYLDVAEGKVGLKPSGSKFEALSAQQTKWMKDAQHFIGGFNMESIAKGFGLPTVEEAAGKAESLARGRSTYEAAKTPSALATSISKLTNIEDIKAAMSFVKSPRDKAVVAANFLKNAFSSISTALKPNLTPEGYGKALDSVVSFGGSDKQAAYEEVFGKSPETDMLVKTMDNAVNSFKAFSEAKTPSALKGAANAGIAAFFASMGHPIIAMGAAKRAIDETFTRGDDVFQEYAGKSKAEILKTLETDGEIDVGKFTKFMRKVGTLMKTRAAQVLTGKGAASGMAEVLSPDDTN